MTKEEWLILLMLLFSKSDNIAVTFHKNYVSVRIKK